MVAIENDPDLVVCYQRVSQEDINLGERRINDDDFLNVRIGVGERISGIIVNVPSNANYDPPFEPYLATAKAYKDKYEKFQEAPITIDLGRLGNIGLCGNSNAVNDVCSSILVHLATHHWPMEVQFAAFSKLQKYEEWKWLRDLPHRNTVFDASLTPIVVLDKSLESGFRQMTLLEEELRRRETLSKSNLEKEKSNVVKDMPALIIVVDHIQNPYDYPALALLLKHGKELNAFGLFLNDQINDIPGECEAVITAKHRSLKLEWAHSSDQSITKITPDDISVIDLGDFSQKLGNIPWLFTSDVTDPPLYVPFLDLFNTVNVDDLSINKWWMEEHPCGYLRTPIGKSSLDNTFLLDLNQEDLAHGPHGFIGGTTGSGKSEILKTIIISYAITHSPYDINFALIDYKGGATFKGFESLPHVVGVITDIEGHRNYARRVILALEGEVQRRKQFLLEAHEILKIEANFDSYHALDTKRIFPRLIIIFDEFAEFKDQHPQESKSLINLARQGRSLGIHLIMCTQNPRAALDPQIRQNSRFRICLRVASKEDSMEILGIPDAWTLPTGRALLQVNNVMAFQGAYPEADYYEDESIFLIRDNGKREPVFSQTTSLRKKQLKIIVEKIQQISSELAIPPIPRIWPDPLPEMSSLTEIMKKENLPPSWNNMSWQQANFTDVTLGRYDDPEHQKQPLLLLSSSAGENDHLIVVGNSGSGKSLLLLTMAQCVALYKSPSEAHIYCIDFSANKTLGILHDLPHLPKEGGVIYADDYERINRLLDTLKLWIDIRQESFRRANSSSLDGYNRKHPASKIPAVFLFIDAFPEHIQISYPEIIDKLRGIVNFGKSSGIYLVITANNYRDIPFLKNIQNRLFLGRAESEQIEAVVGKPPAYYLETSKIAPGRGLWKYNPVMEIQIALPIECKDWELGLSQFEDEIKQMKIAWGEQLRPLDIKKLPPYILYTQLFSEYEKETFPSPVAPIYDLPVGITQERLTRIGFSLESDAPIIWIASNSSKAGKTTILQSWLSYLESKYAANKVRFMLFDFCSKNNSLKMFKNSEHTFQYVGSNTEFNISLDVLEKEINQRKKSAEKILSKKNMDAYDVLSQLGIIIVAIDDFGKLRSSDEKGHDRLAGLLAEGERVGVRTIIAENASLLGSGEIAIQAKKRGIGILLGGSDNLDMFNNAKLKSGQTKTYNLPPGRGYLIKNGEAVLMQAAVYPNGF